MDMAMLAVALSSDPAGHFARVGEDLGWLQHLEDLEMHQEEIQPCEEKAQQHQEEPQLLARDMRSSWLHSYREK